MMRVTTAVCASALALSVGTVQAQTIGAQAASKEKTNVSFSAPVRIPGAVLPAGDYMLRLANPMFADHQTVEIWKKDGDKVATVLTVPIHRPEASNEQVLLFAAAAGQPPALKAWFYPTVQMGHAFVYSKEEARAIASAAAEAVPAADLPTSWETPVSVTVLHIDPSGAEKPWQAEESRTASDRSAGTKSNAEDHLDKAEKALDRMASGADRETVEELRRNLSELRKAYSARAQTAQSTTPESAPAWRAQYEQVERTLDRLAQNTQAIGTSGTGRTGTSDRTQVQDVRQALRQFYQAATGKPWTGKK